MAGVQLAELHDLRVALVGIVKAIVDLGEAFVVADHERSSELAVALAGRFDVGAEWFCQFSEERGTSQSSPKGT